MASGRSTPTTSRLSSADNDRPPDDPTDPGAGPSGREAWSIALGVLVLVLLATLLVAPDLVPVHTDSPGRIPVAVATWAGVVTFIDAD